MLPTPDLTPHAPRTLSSLSNCHYCKYPLDGLSCLATGKSRSTPSCTYSPHPPWHSGRPCHHSRTRWSAMASQQCDTRRTFNRRSVPESTFLLSPREPISQHSCIHIPIHRRTPVEYNESPGMDAFPLLIGPFYHTSTEQVKGVCQSRCN